MTKLSDRINNLSESATIAMAQRSRELKSQGKDVISLSLGEPDFHTPDFIKEAAKNAIDENFTTYTPVPGYLELREAISNKFKRDNHLDYSPEQIVVSTGAKQSIANVMLCLVNPGDEVIMPAPYWVSYMEIAKMAEGIPVVVPAGIEQDFKITAQQLEDAITEKSRVLIYSSPSNPTGSIYTEDELASLAKVIAKHKDLFVISDEIYEYINFTGKHHSIAQFDEIKDQVITVNGLSKGFAMTGWRCGYIGAPAWIAKACGKMQGQVTSGTCSITQRAAIAALEADPEVVTKEMKLAFKNRRDLVAERLEAIDGIKVNRPPGAFYLFPDVSAFFGKSFNGETINNSQDLSMYLLNEALVATVEGDAFGSPDCLRLSIANSEEQLITAMDRITKALEQLS
ncbi:MAG: aspartate aminotransferase [Flavobacteriales bacterium]|nr:aspartate aminotransferase [Flavobacteriales bacterium]|tara:strand:- start:535 stop:1731 length:1197 start_codon:yes stop_codon:yes gene_type:complete